MGKKRLRVEALLAAAASPVPPPAVDLVPDATLADELFPEDLPGLLGLLERADLYLQDEVEVALHPTLTRVWSRAGHAGQRLVQAPGTNAKRYGFGLVGWRDGGGCWCGGVHNPGATIRDKVGIPGLVGSPHLKGVRTLG